MMNFVLVVALICISAAHARLLEDVPRKQPANLHHLITSKLPSSLPPMLTDEECTSECNGRPAEFINNRVECWGDFYWHCAKNESQYRSMSVAAMCSGHFLWLPGVPSPSGALTVCEGLQHFFLKTAGHCPVANITKSMFKGEGCLGTFSSMSESQSAATSLTASLPLPSFLPDFSELVVALDNESSSAWPLNALEGTKIESRCDGKGGTIIAVSWKEENEMTSPIDTPKPSTLTPMEAVKLLQSEVEEEVKVLGLSPPDEQSLEVNGEASIVSHLVQQTEMECEITCNDSPAWFHGWVPCWGKLAVACKSDSGSVVGSCRGLWTGFFGKMCIGLSMDHSQRNWHGHPDNSTTFSDDNFDICSGKHSVIFHKEEGRFAMGSSCHGKNIHREIFVETTASNAHNEIERAEDA